MGKNGRPGATLDDYLYWQERLENREASGLSIDEFCVAEAVSRSTFYRWRQRLREGIPDSVREEGEVPTLADLAEPKFLPVSLTASPVEINCPTGASVRLPVGVGEAVLVKVVEAVGALRPRAFIMINLPLSDVRIFLCTTPIKMQLQFRHLDGPGPDGVRPGSLVGPLVPVLQP